MEHLIDKDAVLAEIESLLDKGKYHEEYDCAYRDGNNSALYALKGKIDTHEVKDFWKSADGDDLPEIDREVIAILDNGKVVFAHRPPEYWDGKDIITGKVTRNYVERYDKGLWNIPNIKYWLDCLMPKEIEQ